MPQLDLKYSKDIQVDTKKLFTEIEQAINNMDSSAGDCKCRAYPSSETHHQHIFITLKLLNKPHRDKAFMAACLAKVSEIVKSYAPEACRYAVELKFTSEFYYTV